MPNLTAGARFATITSGLDLGVGQAIYPYGITQMMNIGYSYHDTSGLFTPGTSLFTARLAVIEGIYGNDPTLFTATTDLTAFGRVLYDIELHDIGPGNIGFIPDITQGLIGQQGVGVSVLLSNGVSATANTHFTAGLFVSAKSDIGTGKGSGYPSAATLAAIIRQGGAGMGDRPSIDKNFGGRYK